MPIMIPATHEDDGHAGSCFRKPPGQTDPVESGHGDVAENEVERAGLDRGPGRLTIIRTPDLVPRLREHLGEQITQAMVVVDD
jgi:hypothetical protein